MEVESKRLPLNRHAPHPAGRLVLVTYCVLCGAVATLAGAVASLLVEGLPVRLAIWLATSAAVATGAGILWGRAPLIPRPPVAPGRPRRPPPPEGPARP